MELGSDFMRNKIINIVVLVFLICTSILTLVVLNKNKGLEKLVVFGQEIEIIKGKSIYEIDMKSAKVTSVNNGCENPIEVIYNGKKPYDGMQYLVAGEKEAYFKFDFDENIDEPENIDAYDLYVHVYLEEPLEIECQNRAE